MIPPLSRFDWEQFDEKSMTKRFEIVLLVAGLFLCAISCAAPEVSVSCMMAYDEGSAPAVLESPECPQWGLSSRSHNGTGNCQFATLQGHRDYQEDHITCNLEMNIRFLGKDGPKEVFVGVAAVFDGHGGKEASEMASKNFLDYFFLHVVFNAYKQALSSKGLNADKAGDFCSNLLSPDEVIPVSGEAAMHDILKKALLSTFHDIDTEFSREAFDHGYVSGSTGTVVLLVDSQMLVASVGDSKALLCSAKTKNALGNEGIPSMVLEVEELTRDHHPDRDDERARIEAAGGFVRSWGVPRVNGILAVSRAIGDVYLKRYGVSPVPEVIDWRHLTANDSYLVVASDGIFESLSPQNVCDLLRDADVQVNEMSKSSDSCSSSSSLADCIVKEAYKKGSGDNLSAIVIPLKFTGLS
ncbi:probable protein phosphatase 2C 51 isoform X1 [Rhododendron vialii]|uniref:probable protein phosphatase 2C 51 isoform X1 n=2 Tax=Rhododendron vialii TaxID=182163 RepID=UPI00265D72A0|nr:probable protein phosphatase 2C 51 isoform X1 [Rhododendron vialii]